MLENRVRNARALTVGAGLSVALFGLALTAFDLVRSYHRDINEARRTTRNLVVALAAHTGRTIQAIDLAINATASHPDTMAALSGDLRLDYHKSLNDRLSGLPQLRSLTIIDAEGRLVDTAPGYPQPRQNFNDRDYFEVLKVAGRDNQLHVGVPLVGRVSGKWFVSLVKRISGPDGAFRGAIMAALDPSFFADLYRDIDVGENGNVTLFHADGMIVARWPAHENFIGKSAAGGVLFRQHLPQEPEGTVRLTTVLESRDILLSYKTIVDRPLVINVAFDLRDVLANWHKSLVFYFATAFGIVMLTTVAVTLMLRVQQRNEALRVAQCVTDAAMRDMHITTVETRARNDFFSAMSHELRTPLNGILGYCQMLRLGLAGAAPNARYDECLANIETSGNHLLATVNDILDLAKITEGQMKLREEALVMAALLAECLAIARGMSGAESQVIDLSGDALESRLRGDKLRLKQIVLNLLSNAIKVTKHGGTVRLSANHAADGGIVVAVDDQGPGMDNDEIRNALKPWSRPDVAVQRSFARTGLGLTLSKALAELHGGALEIVSASGTGTSARVHLPSERVLAEQLGSDTAAGRVSGAQPGGSSPSSNGAPLRKAPGALL